MTVIALDSPVLGARNPARRAMVRWAWRLFRREWRQQLLVLTLITLAVAAAIVGAAIGSNTGTTTSGTFGSANHMVNLAGQDPHLAADIAAVTAQFGPVDVIESANLATGSATPVQVRAQDPAGPYGRAMVKVTDGHWPYGAGEIAVTHQLATRYHLHVGGTWDRAPGGPRRVVGLVENPANLHDTFALVSPGQVAHPDQVTILFDALQSQVAGAHLPTGVQPIMRPPPAGGVSHGAIVLVLAAFGLIFIGLVSAAGFSVMAQRRLRALGMVGSIGATDRDVRLVLVANGAVVGAVGTLVGAAIGLAVWFSYAPHLQVSANHVVDPFHLPWWVIGTCMALAVVTAVLAARWPARAAARVPIVSALSGRPAPPTPVHRSAVPGAVVLGAGLTLLFLGGPGGTGQARSSLFLLGGLVATVVGGLLFSPLAITGLAALAGRTPVAVRLALRDLGRYRSRSGAALGAVSLAVTIAALVCLIASTRATNVVDYVAPNVAANQVVVHGQPDGFQVRIDPHHRGPGKLGPPAPATKPLTHAQQQAKTDAIASAVGATSALPLVDSGATLYRTTHPDYQNFTGTLWVATPQLLRHFGITPEPGADIITSRPGLDAVAHLQLVSNPPLDGPRPDAHERSRATIAHPVIQESSKLPKGTAAPNVVVTEQALRRLGMSPAGGRSEQWWFVETPRPLTSTQKSTAEEIAAAAGMTVATTNGQASLQSLETWSVAAGILLALGVLAMTSGLIRSEAAGDLRTLAATGAGSRIRRTITAATAGGLGLLGGAVGVAVALAGTAAVYHRYLDVFFGHLPLHALVVLVVGLPVAAALGGWVFAGREPPAIAHQPIE